MANVWLNMSEVILSPEFTQPLTVKRHSNGHYVKGRFEQDEEIINIPAAVVSASDAKTLSMIPEGDINGTEKTVYTVEKLYLTTYDGKKDKNFMSDIVIYNGDEYKVIKIFDAQDYGFTKAVISKLGVS